MQMMLGAGKEGTVFIGRGGGGGGLFGFDEVVQYTTPM